MREEIYDLCVIGGGINGAGIARDAALRGLSVILLEADDLASGTSSASTKLIHGGLRYLENYEFGMVRAALSEREVLLRAAPHLIYPIEIVIPHDKAQRPRWMIRIGLWLYDRLGGPTRMHKSRPVDLSVDDFGKSLKKEYVNGFVYCDAWGDDSRLVVSNAVDAAAHGAKILTRMECMGLSLAQDVWSVRARNALTQDMSVIEARGVINATGPWVSGFLERAGLAAQDKELLRVRGVKGSHILVPRQYEGAHLYLLQQPDGRVVFVIPYEGRYTLIGTTEEAYDGDPRAAMISAAETSYLCAAYNRAFSKSIAPEDVVFTYSGVRPLLEDGAASASKVSRDYKIHHHQRYSAPLLSVYGGKLTTYRILARDAVDKFVDIAGKKPPSSSTQSVLPGGNIEGGDFSAFLLAQTEIYPWMEKDLLLRYARAYGTRMNIFLSGVSSYDDLGECFGQDIYRAEIDFLRETEWAMTAEDVLWRRSKLGLHAEDKTVDQLRGYFLKGWKSE